MNLSELRPIKGSTGIAFRKGRGHGSGSGKTAGRGQDGQTSRSGGGTRPGFEGGQMPLYRRLPKRGFTCRNSKTIVGINVSDLNRFRAGTTVDIEKMIANGLVSNPKDGAKILCNVEVTKKLTIKVNAFSKSAIVKIEEAGGQAEMI